jgi:hypothetical protein
METSTAAFKILQNTIIYENTNRNQFLKSDGEYDQGQC